MMRSFNILILFVIPSFTYARFIKGSDPNDIIVWYPPLKTNSTIPPEFAWLYLTNNNQSTESTLQFLLSTENIDFLKNNTAFYLFTEKNRHEPQTLIIDDLDTLKNSNWDPLKPTRIIIHGFYTNSTTEFIVEMKDTLLDLNETSNVITFDWGTIASYIYPNAAYWTDKVGEICGLMIDFLCKHGGQTSQFHLIGHSLGAHVAGFAAKSTSAGRIGRVTGLDPAYPGFITEDATGRLDSSDADFVDCIHTSGGLLAFQAPICGADFYPNGGYVPQPGCSGYFEGTKCSHSRAHQLFLESIMKGHLFPAMTCPELPEEEPVNCVKEGAHMGFPAESKFKGIFYLTTNAEFPFAPIVITRKNPQN